MKIRGFAERGCAVIASLALIVYSPGSGGIAKANEKVHENEWAVTDVMYKEFTRDAETVGEDKILVSNETENKGKKNYIIKTQTQSGLSKITKNYPESDEINENSEGLLKDNKTVSIELSSEQAEKLSYDKTIKYMEEDKIVSASTKKSSIKHLKHKKIHSKKVICHKKNNSSAEWNVRMIRAENMSDNNKPKIKVAILDSGIDWETI